MSCKSRLMSNLKAPFPLPASYLIPTQKWLMLNVIYTDDRSGRTDKEHSNPEEDGFTLVTRHRRINKEGQIRHRRINKEGQMPRAGKHPGKYNKTVDGHKTNINKKDQVVKPVKK